MNSQRVSILTNRCIVLHVVSSGPVSFAELFDLFGRKDGLAEYVAKAKFRKCIEYLVFADRLVQAPGGMRGNRMFAPGTEALNTKQKVQRPEAPKPDAPKPTPKPTRKPKRYAELQSAARTGQVVLAREVNVMHGPLYVPPSAPFYRHGAMDFKGIPSRGHRC